MADLPPYRYHPGEIPEQLARWLELARQCILTGNSNVDTGQIGDSQYLVRTEDLSRASSAVAVADPDFNILLANNAAWALEGCLKFTGTLGGFRFNISGPIDGNFHWAVTDPGTSTTTEDNQGILDDATVATISGNMAVDITGVFRTGANPVPFDMNWGQETSDATALQLDQGSWMRITRVTDAAITPPPPIVLTINPPTL